MEIKKILDRLRSALGRKALFLVLDRDGTLTAIVSRPEHSKIPDRVTTAILALANLPGVAVAILSARGCTALMNDFAGDSIILGGNYGLEVYLPRDHHFVHPVALHTEPVICQLKEELTDLVTSQTQCILEDHVYSLCLHWHLTPASLRAAVHEKIRDLKQRFTTVYFQSMPTSYEIHPPYDWDKSYGMEQIQMLTGFNPGSHLYLYIGDTTSDEPAFRWVNTRGGISVRVGRLDQSNAAFQLATPGQVGELLGRLYSLIGEITHRETSS